MADNILPMLIIFSYSLVLNSMAPLLKSFRELFHISTALSSLLPFFSLTGTVLSNIFVGLYINKLGIKKTLLIGSTLTILGTIVVASAREYWITLIGLLVFGLSTGFGFTGGTTLLSLSKNSNFGLFHGAYGLGGILAPFVILATEKMTGKFEYVYYIYSIVFVLLYTYVILRKFPQISSETFKFRQIKDAFKNRVFSLFLIILVLYSSAEMSTITWAGSIMKENIISSFMSYTLFWLMFTISRFLVNTLSQKSKNLIKFYSSALIVLMSLFFLTKNPIFFVASGFFFGPIFPYVQSRGISLINTLYIPLFNGATYAFTSLGGNIVSTLMGVMLDKNYLLSCSIPIGIVIVIFFISNTVLKTYLE